MKNNYISRQFIKKSWSKLFTTFVLALLLVCSYEKQIKASASTPTPDAAFKYINLTDGIEITDVDTAKFGTNIVVPNQINGKIVVDFTLENKKLSSLDLSNCTALNYLWCNGNALTSLDVSKNTTLTWLRCENNNLTTLDVSKNTALINLFCDGNNLSKLDLSKNTELTHLVCSFNKLTSLDLSRNTKLYNLYCKDNNLPHWM